MCKQSTSPQFHLTCSTRKGSVLSATDARRAVWRCEGSAIVRAGEQMTCALQGHVMSLPRPARDTSGSIPPRKHRGMPGSTPQPALKRSTTGQCKGGAYHTYTLQCDGWPRLCPSRIRLSKARSGGRDAVVAAMHSAGDATSVPGAHTLPALATEYGDGGDGPPGVVPAVALNAVRNIRPHVMARRGAHGVRGATTRAG